MENEERNMFQFIWKIENWSYCFQEENESIVSPSFQISDIEGSYWRLRLFPRGTLLYINFVGLYLERELNVLGPLYTSVDYELSILRSDGTPEYIAAEKGCVFAKGQNFGSPNLATRKEILQTKKSILLPNDTLTIQCRLYLENIRLRKQSKLFARATVNTCRELYLWDAGEFNYVTPNGVGYFSNLTLEQVDLRLLLSKDSLRVNLRTIIDVARTFRFRIGILNSNSSISQFLVDQYMFFRFQSITTFLIKRSRLLKRKDLYLPDGRLILHCELTYGNGIYIDDVEGFSNSNIFKFYISDERQNSTGRMQTTEESSCWPNNFSSMKNDFENLYQEGTLFDFTIKIGGENLLAHKAVLCARSPVFKAMLTSNMEECERNMVEIHDLEKDTIRNMLIFMYTDTTDDLNWERASKLYFAANQYDISTLKHICFEYLKINLSVANFNDILALAITHAHIGQIKRQSNSNVFKFSPSDERKNSTGSRQLNDDSGCRPNNYSSMKNDLKNLYQEGTISDFTIKVGSEIFQAHKAVLCARSPVFKAMLTSHMKESEKNMVEIEDLEKDTVRRMLLFMYVDTTDDLNWEVARKLYFASDKYDIPTLKQICSEFLKINLSVSNVEDVLALANTHADGELNKVALKFMECIKE